MKKSYLMMAAAATMLAACSQSDVLNEVQVQEEAQAIGFSTYASKATRAAENSGQTETKGLNLHHEDFIVWGYKNTADAYVFNGVDVNYQDGIWAYSPTKYWDKAANSYEFYAAAPNNGKWVLEPNTAAQGDDYFKYSNLELKDESHSSVSYQESFYTLTKNEDLMIANPKPIGREQILGAGKVQFEFNHILSRLNITVKKHADLNGEEVKLENISVNKLINIASFSEETPAVAEGTTERWAKTENTYTLTGNKLDYVSNELQYVLQSLVIPQNAGYEVVYRDGNCTKNKPYIYLEYTIGTELFKATYNLSDAFNTKLGVDFNEGWQNTLHITINADKIEFDAVVFDWKDDAKEIMTIK